MKETEETLEQDFVTDHQRMTKTLARLSGALQSGDDEAAKELADELDRVGGPHIAFEESVLYPAVGLRAGEDFRKRLVGEHAEVLDVIRSLQNLEPGKPLGSQERIRLLEELKTGLRHVETCGRLLSHLTAMPEDDREQAHTQLLDARQRQLRWTELKETRL